MAGFEEPIQHRQLWLHLDAVTAWTYGQLSEVGGNGWASCPIGSGSQGLAPPPASDSVTAASGSSLSPPRAEPALMGACNTGERLERLGGHPLQKGDVGVRKQALNCGGWSFTLLRGVRLSCEYASLCYAT